MKVALYLRVSTKGQGEDDKLGLPVQLARLQAFCGLNKHEITGCYQDKGCSGSTAERPALARLVADASVGQFEVVAVYKWDRLARDTTLDGFLRYRLKQLGVSVISATEENGRDPISEMTQSILAAVAQYERHLIKQRLLAARQLKKSRGGYAAGRPRYGMKTVGGTLLVDGHETEAIELARKLRRRRKTYREIAHILVDNGFVARSLRPWSLGTLYNMLNCRLTKKRVREYPPHR